MVDEQATDEQVAHNEAVIIGDDRLVRVALKMRARRAELLREFEAADKVIKDQQAEVENEIQRRLIQRGATQTKTAVGTAYLAETMKATIADDATFRSFVLETKDLEWFQKRVKVEHLKEYMKEKGVLPPGVNVHREFGINIRAPRKTGAAAAAGPEAFDDGLPYASEMGNGDSDNNVSPQEK
jgi:hypothetical protein